MDKHREIYFIDNIKFHIDTIKGLGDFVEIEVIDITGTKDKKQLYEQCDKYMKLFNIKDDDLVSVSYSDMLLDNETKKQNF